MGGFAHQDSWQKRLCSGRRVILILMGFLAVVSLSLIILGFVGHNYSTTLRKMKEDVKTSNRTLAVALADLEQEETNDSLILKNVEEMVKFLSTDATEVKSQYLNQIQKLQETLQKLNCDLQDIKHKGRGPASGCCPRGWHLFQQSCYWFSSAENNQDEAEEDCEEKNAHLVIITSRIEKHFVLRLTKPHSIWIKVTSNSYFGSFNMMRRSDRRPHQPRYDTYCTMMYEYGMVSTLNCRTRMKWMCEKPAQQ